MPKQLYSFIPDIVYPAVTRIDHSTGEYFLHQENQTGYYSFVWPNGAPCILIEMFLQEKSKFVKISKKDGGTIGNYASHLSHFVRYCYNNKIEFWNLRHADIDHFILLLANEVNEFSDRKRDNNTVKSIISSCITFLEWLQNSIATDRNIVGITTNDNRFQISLKLVKFQTEKGVKISNNVFPSSLPPSISREKRPMSTAARDMLWDALSKSKSESKCSNKLKSLFTKKQQKDHVEYMHARREIQLVLLEATGLRPQELVTIKASKNTIHLQKSNILLPTLKRRGKRVSERLIPVDRYIAMKLEIFINKHRRLLIDRLLYAGVIKSKGDIDDVVYLNSETGKEVMPDAAYQEFRRLTFKANISQKNCQSMFRHRFITNMVKLHLIGFMDKNPLKSRQLMTDNDYRTILKKVAQFTGHKNLDSLLYYIDMAWEELDAFSFTYEIKELQDRLKAVFYSVNSIKSELNGLKNKQSTAVLNKIIDNLSLIESIATSPNINKCE